MLQTDQAAYNLDDNIVHLMIFVFHIALKQLLLLKTQKPITPILELILGTGR